MDKREETVEEKNGKTQNMKKTEVKFLVLNPRISLSVGVPTATAEGVCS